MRKDKKTRSWEYCIHPYGLCADTIGDVVIDGKFTMETVHTQNMLYLKPLSRNLQPSISEAWFYCDCISYEHEIPAIVMPTPSEVDRFKYCYVSNGPKSMERCNVLKIGDNDETIRHPYSDKPLRPIPSKILTRNFFMNSLHLIFEETREMRHGPSTFVLFKTHKRKHKVNLKYTEKYGLVSKELGIYSTALRQADFLSEFLGYYRVLESILKTNNCTRWMANGLNELPLHKFTKIMLGHSHDSKYTPRNILGTYKRRTSIRLKQLQKKHGSNDSIAKYLYNTIRCGIAHGRDNNAIRGDIVPSYFDIVRDTYIVKMLTRMAIDKRVSGLL